VRNAQEPIIVNRSKRFVRPAIVLFTGLFGLLLAGTYLTYGNLDPSTFISLLLGSPSVTRQSPDGRHYVITELCRRKDGDEDAYLCVQLRIHDQSGRLVQQINTHASDVHRWDVQWTDNDTILVSSGDIGDREYVRTVEGTWQRKEQAVIDEPNEGVIKRDVMVKIRSRIGNTIVLPSQWTSVDSALDGGYSFLLSSPDGQAAINILSFTAEGIDDVTEFRTLIVSQMEGDWQKSEWEKVDFGGVTGMKRHLTSADEDAESAWRVYVLQNGECYHAILLHASSAMMLLNGGFYEECIRSFKGVSKTQ
jgi:hypothetical protein